MISMSKSIICTEEGQILGHRWHSRGYFTAEDKKIKALLELPHKEMLAIPPHSLYGLLNFFQNYVPDFAICTKPIRKLLSHLHDNWTIEHTECAKDVLSRILNAMPLLNFDPASPIHV